MGHHHEKTVVDNPPAMAFHDGGHRPQANSDQDVAIAIVGERAQVIDPAMEARVVRKIDIFLIPAMIVMYGLVYYDSEYFLLPSKNNATDWSLIFSCRGNSRICSPLWHDF